MATYKLTLGYDGTDFSGWQSQPNQRTVQGVLQAAWSSITGESAQLTATSRTDAGVHAYGQVVGITTESALPAHDLWRGVNAKLPEDVILHSVEEVHPEFHATHDAIAKLYRYQIHSSRKRPLFDRRFVWHVPQRLDTDAMQRAAGQWIGEHDFASFQTAGSPRDSTVRTILAINVLRQEDPERIWIEVEGDGFLYNMVRNIVGTLLEIGVGRRPESWAQEVLVAQDRRAAGQTAPAQGLHLMWVKFPET